MINLNTSCSEGTLLSVAEIAVLKLQICVQVCFNKRFLYACVFQSGQG